MTFTRFLLVWLALLAAPGCGADTPALDRIKLPPGFRIEVWARVDNPRALALGAAGTVFAGSRSAGKVYAIAFDPQMRATSTYTVARDLNMPVGVAFRDGSLYVSAVNRILRLPQIETRLADPPRPELVSDAFPKETHHGWKFIAFGPDGKLYVPVGAPCNICQPDPDRYANIMRMNADGSGLEVFARGVRNSVGFTWHPRSGDLWFTDNGRDWLGDDRPPCELNRAPKAGMHFGYPYCHGADIADPEFGGQRRCQEFTPPAKELGAHVAPLGLRFYNGSMFPAAYRDALFVAEHGSWNRSRKSGYRVMVAHLEDGRVARYEPFASGWLQGESAWGRPADLLVMPDGSLLVSDDGAGAIYRISYAAGKS